MLLNGHRPAIHTNLAIADAADDKRKWRRLEEGVSAGSARAREE